MKKEVKKEENGLESIEEKLFQMLTEGKEGQAVTYAELSGALKVNVC